MKVHLQFFSGLRALCRVGGGSRVKGFESGQIMGTLLTAQPWTTPLDRAEGRIIGIMGNRGNWQGQLTQSSPVC